MSKNHHFKSITLIYKTALRFVFCILIITIVAGCAGKKSETKDTFFEKWKIKAEQSKGFSPSARKRAVDLPEKTMEEKAKQEALVPELEKSLPSGKISLKMRNIELSVLLRTLAKAVNQNIIINEKVGGKVNINIEDAPWDQVFQGVLRSYGLTYAWEGDIIRILTLEDMQQDIARETQKREMERVEPLLTKVVQISFADSEDLKKNLEKFLAEKTDGKTHGSVMVDKHTNALILQATRNDIEIMLPLIEELDRPIPQVLIEANIVETSKETARDLGIQWGGRYRSKDFQITSSGGPGGRVPILGEGGEYNPFGTDSKGFGINFPAGVVGGGASLGLMFGKLTGNILDMQLTALQEEGKLNILSSPSIVTLDNQEAVIESGRDIPFKVTSGDNIGDIEYKKATLSLKVTPHVIDDKTIKIEIEISKDEPDFINDVDGNPTIITKSAKTTVILFNGQTTVIGGLSKETMSQGESGVPGLKDIPILGYLFKGESKSKDMEEILIFITPHILEQKIISEE